MHPRRTQLGAKATYRTDLAYIHDAGFGHFARAAAPVLLEALKRGGHEHGLVVDLGCGSGILSRLVSDAGYDVLGIDISKAMIALARERVPRGRFEIQSLLSAEIPSCAAVAAVGECLNYLFDASHSRSGLKALFRRIYRALVPGGLFMGDAAEPGRVPGGSAERNFGESVDWAVLVVSREDRRRKLLTREITCFRKIGAYYRRDHEVHQLRLLPRVQLGSDLRQAGFRLRLLSGYGSLQFGPGHWGFLARKPASNRRNIDGLT